MLVINGMNNGFSDQLRIVSKGLDVLSNGDLGDGIFPSNGIITTDLLSRDNGWLSNNRLLDETWLLN